MSDFQKNSSNFEDLCLKIVKKLLLFIYLHYLFLSHYIICKPYFFGSYLVLTFFLDFL